MTIRADKVVDNRFVIYESMLISFFVGVVTMLCAFQIGKKVVPSPPRAWKTWTLVGFFNDNFYDEVDVTKELRDTIQELFDMTTESK